MNGFSCNATNERTTTQYNAHSHKSVNEPGFRKLEGIKVKFIEPRDHISAVEIETLSIIGTPKNRFGLLRIDRKSE
jgi:hypothetical protein